MCSEPTGWRFRGRTFNFSQDVRGGGLVLRQIENDGLVGFNGMSDFIGVERAKTHVS